MRIAQPWLLVFAGPLLLLLLWRLRHLPRDFGGRRRKIQLVMALAGITATLAIAGLELGRRVDRLAVVFAVDRSRSIDHASQTADDAMRMIRESTDDMPTGDQAGVVIFGAGATTELLPSPQPPIGALRATVPRDATDLAAGIRRALADIPAEHTGRVVVVSDGVETRGDALAAAALAASRGVVVDVLPIERAPEPEVAVERVRVPPHARPGEPVEVRIVTQATHRTAARVRVTRGGTTIAETETVLRAGSDVLVMRDEAPEAGVHRYDVLVEPLEPGHDVGRTNNEGGAFMRVLGGSRVLVAASEPAEVQALVAAVRDSGLQVEVTDGPRFPLDLGELAAYDLVILSDLESRTFTREQMNAVASYVRDLGGGLLMAGARKSFGLGGYAYTPIEEVLPARFDLRQRRDRLSLAMVIAIDNSGSMMAEAAPGVTKLEMANEAAARSALLLSPMDRVGVVHVDTAVTWTQPMVSVDSPGSIAGAVRRAQAGGGGIYVDITMEAAYGALRSEETQLKHFLLFSDGSDSENLSGTRQMVRRAMRDRITTSIVSMGRGSDSAELEHLSRLGGGRFYIVDDMTQLPRIFTQETIEASRAALVEEPFRTRTVMAGPATRGIDFGGAPALGGYSVVNARGRATVLLRAKDEEDPLLAVWQHGVGRSGVFTTDVGAEFGQPWLGWGGYSVLFSQLSRDLARAPERRDAQVSLTIENGIGRVRVEAVSDDGRYRNYLDLGGTVAGPGGRSLRVDLEQTGAGRYEGTFDANAPGPYLVTVTEDERGMVGSAGMVRPSGDELRGDGTNHALLGQVAALTGGEVREDLRRIFTDRPPPTYAYDPLWPFLLMASLLLFLLGVAMRRLVLPPGFFARLVPRRRKKKKTPKEQAAEARSETLGALASRKRGKQEEAEEIRRALAASEGTASQGPAPLSGASGPTSRDEEPPDDEPPAEPPASSLAEQLLAKKRKR